MPVFSKGIPRILVLVMALAFFVLMPPEMVSHGPNLCLWRHLFHISACPGCGTVRALAAFFHGHVLDALRFNLNVVVTAPVLLVLFASDFMRFFRRRITRE